MMSIFISQNQLQIVYLFLNRLADICIPHPDSLLLRLKNIRAGLNILILLQNLFDALKRLMRFQPHSMGVVYQGISRNTSLLMVGFAEPAVNNNQLSICAHRNLTFADLDRRMSIDNVGHGGKSPNSRKIILQIYSL